MDEQQSPLDDAQIQRAAGLIFGRVAHQRTEVEQLGPPAPSSPLAGDDRTAHPHKVSQAAYRALGTATEHLAALRALVLQAKMLHPTAPYTLNRAAIETGAAAVWLLAPTTRPPRVIRSLQLTVGDAIDADTVASETGLPMRRPLEERRAEIDQLAQTIRGGALTRLPRASSSSIVRAADAACSSPVGVLTAWRVCSGFAHGRLWATLAVLQRDEVVDLPAPGDVGLRVTNSLDRLIWATMAAVDVVDTGLRLYRKRAASPYVAR